MTENAAHRPRWELPPRARMAALILLGVVIVGGIALALRPRPVAVDIGIVDRGDIEVAVEEDGRTRFRDRYLLTAPTSGELARVTVRAGDRVEAGEVLARIGEPSAAILDPRTREQLELRVSAAEARVRQAEAMVEVARAALVEANEELRRQELLLEMGGGSRSAVERAGALVSARSSEVTAAELTVRAAEAEREDLRVALAGPAGGGAGGNAGRSAAEGSAGGGGAGVALRSPVAGVVLAVHRESAGLVAPGEPILEVGDPGAVEVVVDLLSADAARVVEGAEAWISGWGEEGTLAARVRRVEPAGFTRLSALGIEEQRVNVLLELAEDAEGGLSLGDGYRVEARILLERQANVLRVPTSALFRRGEAWTVFRVVGGRVEEAVVEVGARSQTLAEIRSGLTEGDRVVVYPSDRVAAGVRVRER